MQAKPVLLEPVQKVFINTPQDYMGDAMRELSNRRGQILDMEQEGDMTLIKSKAPVSEMFGFAGAIRGATQVDVYGVLSLEDSKESLTNCNQKL